MYDKDKIFDFYLLWKFKEISHIFIIIKDNKKYVKYDNERICLINTYGDSIGWAPAQVKRMKIFVNIQNINWLIGYNDNELKFILIKGKV